jgi:hypothetical protein
MTSAPLDTAILTDRRAYRRDLRWRHAQAGYMADVQPDETSAECRIRRHKAAHHMHDIERTYEQMTAAAQRP